MTTQKEYIEKLKQKILDDQEEKQSKLKEKIEMPRHKNKNYNHNRRRSKRYNAEDYDFGPAEVAVRDGNVIRAYKRLQKILQKDGTLRIAKERRRFNPDKHKNQKR